MTEDIKVGQILYRKKKNPDFGRIEYAKEYIVEEVVVSKVTKGYIQVKGTKWEEEDFKIDKKTLFYDKDYEQIFGKRRLYRTVEEVAAEI